MHFFVDRLPEDGHQMCDNETPRKGKAALHLIGPSIGLLFCCVCPLAVINRTHKPVKQYSSFSSFVLFPHRLS